MPSKIVVNCQTGLVEEVELTAEEVVQMEADAEAYAEAKALEEQIEAETEANAETGKAKLKALGLTDDEINALMK